MKNAAHDNDIRRELKIAIDFALLNQLTSTQVHTIKVSENESDNPHAQLVAYFLITGSVIAMAVIQPRYQARQLSGLFFEQNMRAKNANTKTSARITD